MGSGSSKEKAPKKSSTQAKVDQNIKGKNLTNRNQKVSSIGANDHNDLGHTNKTQSVNNNIKDIPKQATQNLNGDTNRTHGGGGGTKKKNIANFESDSESETEDINEVLEATRREHEERVKEQNYYNTRHTEETDYPETYAQRQQRTQYKPELGIIRQKTIYRNPDEWQLDEEELQANNIESLQEYSALERGNEDGFDVNKFKQANATKTVQNVQDRDIFSPSEIKKPNTRSQYTDADDYYKPVLHKQKSLPKYDMSEEALLAEIEKEYDF